MSGEIGIGLEWDRLEISDSPPKACDSVPFAPCGDRLRGDPEPFGYLDDGRVITHLGDGSQSISTDTRAATAESESSGDVEGALHNFLVVTLSGMS